MFLHPYQLGLLALLASSCVVATKVIAPPPPAPIINVPAQNAVSVHFPNWVSDELTVCVQTPFSEDAYTCEYLSDLRRILLSYRRTD